MKKFRRIITAILVMSLFSTMVVGCATETKEHKAEREEKQSKKYQVGDVIETDELKITYKKADVFVSDNEYIQPGEGKEFIYIEIEAENISKDDAYISIMDFNCYADGVECDYGVYMDDAISANLSPTRKAVGTVSFTVPKDAKSIEIEYDDNPIIDGHYVLIYK